MLGSLLAGSTPATDQDKLKDKKTMKTMNVIFAVIFALCALMALSAVIFYKALHQLPVFALCALMAATTYNSDKTKQQQ